MNPLSKIDPEFLKQFLPQFWAGIVVIIVVAVWRWFIKQVKFIFVSPKELKMMLGEQIKKINYNKSMGDTYNISSNKQSGGFTGVLNVNKPRELNQKLKDQLAEIIPDKNFTVRVTAVLGDGEAIQFASEIKNYLEAEKYNVEGVNQAIYTKAPKGQIINKKDNKTIEIIIGHK